MIHTKATILQRNGKTYIELPDRTARKLHAKNHDEVTLSVESRTSAVDHAHYNALDPKEARAFYRALEIMYGSPPIGGNIPL